MTLYQLGLALLVGTSTPALAAAASALPTPAAAGPAGSAAPAAKPAAEPAPTSTAKAKTGATPDAQETTTARAALPQPAAAPQTAVLPVHTIHFGASSADAIGSLLAQAYASESGHAVLGPDAVRQAAGDLSEPAAIAAKLHVQDYIVVRVVGLHHKISVRATLYEAPDGRRVYSARMTAWTLDDGEQVASRLAEALYDRVPIMQTLNRHNVTRTEARPENRTFTEKVIGIKTRFIGAFAAHEALEPVMALQFDARFETTHAFYEFAAGPAFPSNTSDSRDGYGGLFVDLGANYYLSDADTAAYLGGGIEPRLLFSNQFESPGLGIVPYVQLGLMFMRQSSSRIYVDLRVGQNVMPAVKKDSTFDSYGDPIHTTTKRAYATEAGLSVGIGW